MNWRQPLIVRTAVFLLTATVVVGSWALYERAVAGAGYRWTTWEDLKLVRPPTKAEPAPPLDAKARSLVGTAIFLLAQEVDFGVIHIPHQEGFDQDTPDIDVLNIDKAFYSDEGGGVVRVWGRISLMHGNSISDNADEEYIPLKINVDRYQLDPPFLPAAVAPTTSLAWTCWAFAGGTAGLLFMPLVNLFRRLFCNRLIVRATVFILILITVATTVTWAFVPGLAAIQFYNGRNMLAVSAGRSGFMIDWIFKCTGLSSPPIRTFRYNSFQTPDTGPLGIALTSYYPIYSGGKVNPHITFIMSSIWIMAFSGLLAFFVWRYGQRRGRKED